MLALNEKLMKRIISGVVLSAVSFVAVYMGGIVFLLYIAAFASVALYEWISLAFQTKQSALYIFAGLVYVALSFGCCLLIRANYPVEFIILFFFMVAFSDMGAYAFGKLIGGPKMAKGISPKKTWAGFAGALLSPALIGLVFAAVKYGFGQLYIVALFFALGAVMGGVGQAGDLVVSFLKRQAGAKDTGDIIPGHGGVLDRIDAMMLAMPVFFLFLLGVQHGIF